MVDPGEKISATLRREFSEEALGSLDMNPENQLVLRDKIKELFKHGTLVCLIVFMFIKLNSKIVLV